MRQRYSTLIQSFGSIGADISLMVLDDMRLRRGNWYFEITPSGQRTIFCTSEALDMFLGQSSGFVGVYSVKMGHPSAIFACVSAFRARIYLCRRLIEHSDQDSKVGPRCSVMLSAGLSNT
jgi:sugar/nucleoside kinase (ribokinase family)